MSMNNSILPSDFYLNPPDGLMDKNKRREMVLRDIVDNPDEGSPAIEATPGNSGYYELGILHPAVAEWLNQNGYTYEHHYIIPDVGIVDFYAKRDNEILIVDAKESPKALSRSLTQISDYRYHVGKHAEAAIALPLYTVTDKSRTMCQKRNIGLIALNIEEKTVGTKYRPAMPPMPSALWTDWFFIYGGCDTPTSEWSDVDWNELKRWKAMNNWCLYNR